MTKKKDDKAKVEDYPNLMPVQKDGLTVTKADFETRRIQAMAAVAAASRRYQNFWRAVRFGNQYMLAFVLAGLAANYQKEGLMEAVGGSAAIIGPAIAAVVFTIGLSNLVTWAQLYQRMSVAITQEAQVTQIQSEANHEGMTWSTMQHFMVQALLVLAAIGLWFGAFA